MYNKLHFCLVNLSFANLICRASTNRPKMGRGNTIFFPGGSDGKESACNVGEPGSICCQEDPLEKEMATHSSTLAWEI